MITWVMTNTSPARAQTAVTATQARRFTDGGVMGIDVPRGRDSLFEPQMVKKQQTRFTGMDDKILFLYAQGMTTREICTALKELYDADVSVSLISKLNQCGNGTSCRMAITPARSGISYCLL